MDPPGTETNSIGYSFRMWLAALIELLELRIELLGIESREAAFHVLGLALLLVTILTLLAGFMAMLVVFFLFLLMWLFGWPWGWSALALAGALLVLSLIMLLLFRGKITVPLFEASFAELHKDREWLNHGKRNSG